MVTVLPKTECNQHLPAVSFHFGTPELLTLNQRRLNGKARDFGTRIRRFEKTGKNDETHGTQNPKGYMKPKIATGLRGRDLGAPEINEED